MEGMMQKLVDCPRCKYSFIKRGFRDSVREQKVAEISFKAGYEEGRRTVGVGSIKSKRSPEEVKEAVKLAGMIHHHLSQM